MSMSIVAEIVPAGKVDNWRAEWHPKRLLIPTDGFSSSIEVDALVSGWVAVRHGVTGGNLTRRTWVAFYVPTGLAFATADTQEEAQRAALAFKPLLQHMIDEFMEAVRTYNQTRRLPAESEGR